MTDKKTVTSIFILPVLKIGKDRLVTNGFINAYSKDSHREIQYDNCIYVLFKPKNVDAFREFLDAEYERCSKLLDDYHYEDEYIVLVYEIDESYKNDINLIKKGKYSKTSPSFQALFPKHVTVIRNGVTKEELSLQYRVFNKSEDLIKYWEEKLDVVFDSDQELWEIFIEENETLNLNKIKEN
jgi:hypothetical protein